MYDQLPLEAGLHRCLPDVLHVQHDVLQAHQRGLPYADGRHSRASSLFSPLVLRTRQADERFDVSIQSFCSPCLESLWLKQLSKISLIDDLKASVSSGQSCLFGPRLRSLRADTSPFLQSASSSTSPFSLSPTTASLPLSRHPERPGPSNGSTAMFMSHNSTASRAWCSIARTRWVLLRSR